MEKQFLGLKEAALFLNISESTLYKKSMRNEIPKYKPNNGKIFFKIEDLNNYILKSFVDVKTTRVIKTKRCITCNKYRQERFFKQDGKVFETCLSCRRWFKNKKGD